jgi:hypothetical protein
MLLAEVLVYERQQDNVSFHIQTAGHGKGVRDIANYN